MDEGLKTTGGLKARIRGLSPEILRFAAVGSIGFVTDLAVFDLLRGVMDVNPLLSKVVSVSISTTVAYFGNRLWTYRERTREQETATATKQYAAFYIVNLIGMLIQLLSLWFSHYVLDFTSLLADNISGSGIGMAVATVFRFWAYRTLVFRHEPAPAAAGGLPDAPVLTAHE